MRCVAACCSVLQRVAALVRSKKRCDAVVWASHTESVCACACARVSVRVCACARLSETERVAVRLSRHNPLPRVSHPKCSGMFYHEPKCSITNFTI